MTATQIKELIEEFIDSTKDVEKQAEEDDLQSGVLICMVHLQTLDLLKLIVERLEERGF